MKARIIFAPDVQGGWLGIKIGSAKAIGGHCKNLLGSFWEVSQEFSNLGLHLKRIKSFSKTCIWIFS
ncbi:hypothetical protein COX24_03195 [bacterium (Candidatus Gribaldobacteria) CG23_combo_of_CG06-09_8_20_14_all_37_87_8]|uniref:Uncharacterized protein n=2 Tax=Candidatus Gribaldobacteria TaxID=2798536 RepID=A0A2G9ZEE7_9BACT|nr:MAG: hypothetical protein AUJ25_01475 [Parcubacteria group bacterium CG1_02_37_13]PIP31517.1 MAG: hypothetical protein COX24_03195 [bacterium (Candidatus Gribaldobacteria) CG23_combo_of_CG06-09_8_20_14_all_37_87_8]PIR90645.1 MAG: hypothetical protein COU05_00750 [bacterium (Candidatus Gribaldobacteria) CG10_big_fil_rev_8_21_14_0_10_37_21]